MGVSRSGRKRSPSRGDLLAVALLRASNLEPWRRGGRPKLDGARMPADGCSEVERVHHYRIDGSLASGRRCPELCLAQGCSSGRAPTAPLSCAGRGCRCGPLPMPSGVVNCVNA